MLPVRVVFEKIYKETRLETSTNNLECGIKYINDSFDDTVPNKDELKYKTLYKDKNGKQNIIYVNFFSMCYDKFIKFLDIHDRILFSKLSIYHHIKYHQFKLPKSLSLQSPIHLNGYECLENEEYHNKCIVYKDNINKIHVYDGGMKTKIFQKGIYIYIY